MEIPIEKDMEKISTKPRTNKFKMEAKHIFLTYPNLQNIVVTPQEYLEQTMINIKQTFPQLESAIVCWEYHKSTGSKGQIPHMHAAIHLKENPNAKKGIWNLKGLTWLEKFDKINPNGKHGDYQSCKNWQKSVMYLTKEGVYVLHNIDLECLKHATKKHTTYGWEVCAQSIVQGKSIEDINNTNPGWVLQHGKKLEQYSSLIESWYREKKLPWYGVKVSKSSASVESKIIVEWINKNVMKPRKHKQKQLYICGPANMGKTWLWNSCLSQCLRIYVVPNDKEWYDQYTDDYDLIVFDEFSGKTITWMNGFVEGSQFPVSKRGSKPYMKKKNIPVMVLSNKTISESFPNVAKENPAQLEAFEIRFEYIQIDEMLKIKLEDPPFEDQVENIINSQENNTNKRKR